MAKTTAIRMLPVSMSLVVITASVIRDLSEVVNFVKVSHYKRLLSYHPFTKKTLVRKIADRIVREIIKGKMAAAGLISTRQTENGRLEFGDNEINSPG